MRVFQNSGINPSYRIQGRPTLPASATFRQRVADFLDTRFVAAHFLAPVLKGEEWAFFTNGDDELMQHAWARENNLPETATLEDILLAQIEAHRTEVFYNLDPMRYGSDFLRKLPGCVRKSFAWRAAPSPGANFTAYDLILCNFPNLMQVYRANGWKTAYFSPSHDPVMDLYAENNDRPIDVLFVGGYSQAHVRRAEIIEAVAKLRGRYRIEYCLNMSRLTRLAETPLGVLPPLRRFRRPKNIQVMTQKPVFGRDLYAKISQSKIVLNGHGSFFGLDSPLGMRGTALPKSLLSIAMNDKDRGNMRCFETLGCRALMVSDEGKYPKGFEDGVTMRTYGTAADAVSVIESSLYDYARVREIVEAGNTLVRTVYSKEAQWAEFERLAG